MNNSFSLRYLSAFLLTLPIGAVIWFEVAYFYFGVTSFDPPTAFHWATAAVGFAAPFVWMLRGTTRPAEVVRRGCRLGGIVAVLLPLVAVAVLLLWEGSTGRRDLGMGGLMLYSMPVVAFGVAVVFVLVFWVCDRFAAKRLRNA